MFWAVLGFEKPKAYDRGKTPDEMENPNWGLATLTCLIDKSISEAWLGPNCKDHETYKDILKH